MLGFRDTRSQAWPEASLRKGWGRVVEEFEKECAGRVWPEKAFRYTAVQVPHITKIEIPISLGWL